MKNFNDLARSALIDNSCSHHITYNKIVFEYYGSIYNSTLDCLVRSIEKCLIQAYDEGYKAGKDH